MTEQTIVVGVDLSEHSRQAARFALAEAVRRGARLVGVCAFRPPENWVEGYEIAVRPSLGDMTRNVEAQVRQLFREVAEDLDGQATEVPVDALAVVETPVRALLDRSRDADLLVVGHRGRGALSSALLGSVGLQCVLHACCPITVVRAAPAEQPVDETGVAATPGEA